MSLVGGRKLSLILKRAEGLAKFITTEDSPIDSRVESKKSALYLNDSLHSLKGKLSE